MIPPDGLHLAFPFRLAPDGRTATAKSLPEHVRDELMQLILTNPAERAFLPAFGSGVRRLLFEGINDTSAAVTKAMITQAISTWLGQRITLEDLQVSAKESTIVVDLAYRIAGTDESRQMRFERKGG